MSLRIVIWNLPPATSAERVRTALLDDGIAAEIALNDEGNADRVMAIVILHQADRPTADLLAERIDGTLYEGRRLHAFVTLFL
jgi:hypothetical protein